MEQFIPQLINVVSNFISLDVFGRKILHMHTKMRVTFILTFVLRNVTLKNETGIQYIKKYARLKNKCFYNTLKIIANI